MIVLDASAAVELLLDTLTGRRVRERLAAGEEELVAPHLLDLEVARVLRRPRFHLVRNLADVTLLSSWSLGHLFADPLFGPDPLLALRFLGLVVFVDPLTADPLPRLVLVRAGLAE